MPVEKVATTLSRRFMESAEGTQMDPNLESSLFHVVTNYQNGALRKGSNLKVCFTLYIPYIVKPYIIINQ